MESLTVREKSKTYSQLKGKFLGEVLTVNFKGNRETFLRKLQGKILPFIYRKDLRKLATFYGTSKWNEHWYAQHYNKHFKSLRLKKLKILEIGIGGHQNFQLGGESLRMWKTYFPNSMIYGIDIVDKEAIEEKRIKTFRGSQDDEFFLRRVIEEIGKPDIIIDDGSHNNEHVIKSFNILFPTLNNGGIYVVEDTFTSYWPNLDKYLSKPREKTFGDGAWWGKVDGSLDENDPRTTINFFKGMINCLNHQEFLKPGYSPSYFDKHIIALHFYHNLIFVYKGDNSEGSLFMENNTLSSEILRELDINSLEELGLDLHISD